MVRLAMAMAPPTRAAADLAVARQAKERGTATRGRANGTASDATGKNSTNDAIEQTDAIEENEVIDFLIHIILYLAIVIYTSRWTRIKHTISTGGSMDNRIEETRHGKAGIVDKSSWENDYTEGKTDHDTRKDEMKLRTDPPRARMSKLISRAVRKDTGHEERLDAKTRDKMIKHEAMDVMHMHYNAVAIEIMTGRVMEHSVGHDVSSCTAVHRSTVKGATVKKGETGWRSSRCQGQALYGT